MEQLVHSHQHAPRIGCRPADRLDHFRVGPRAPAIPPVGFHQRRSPLLDSTTTQQAQALPEMGHRVVLVEHDHRLGRLPQPLPVPAGELTIGVVVQLTPLARSHVGFRTVDRIARWGQQVGHRRHDHHAGSGLSSHLDDLHHVLA